MSDLKISQMPKATVLSGEEIVPIVQNGSNKTADINLIKKDLATQSWVQDQINEMHKVIVVPTLPETGVLNKIYLIPNGSTKSNDIYDEYIWLGPTDKWEFLGNKQVTVDLSPYYTKVETEERYVGKEAGKGLSTNDYTAADKTAVGTITNKVDKVSGKGLSTNDYTTAEKTVVGTIVNKVDKVNGKQLSTEDYTSAEKTKLGGIAEGANNYVHPNTEGNRHIPAGGKINQVLTYLYDGYATWRDLPSLEDLYSYGVSWASGLTSPTRIGNLSLHKSLPIQSSFRGCLAEGGKIKKYLDRDSWGREVLDGTEGTVRIHIPRFYCKYKWDDYSDEEVRISTIQIDGTWTEIPEMLIDAYHCTVDKTNPAKPRAVSVKNTTPEFRGGADRADYDTYLDSDPFKTDLGKPRTGVNRKTMREYAANAGSELLCYEYYKWIFYWCYVIEYCNFNSQDTFNASLTGEGYRQGGLGPGVTGVVLSQWTDYNTRNPLIPCGLIDTNGNNTKAYKVSMPSPLGETSVPYWRGFENPFGSICTQLEGILVKREPGELASRIYMTTNPTAFDDTIENKTQLSQQEPPVDGYMAMFAMSTEMIGSGGDIIPSAGPWSSPPSGGIGKFDYHKCRLPDDTTPRTLIVGGNASEGSDCGLAYNSTYYDTWLSNSFVGYRTLTRIKK